MNNDLSNESVAWRKLRPYQAKAVETVDRRLSVPGPLVRGYVELPTGSGKTVIAAVLAARWWVRQRSPILFLAHRRELVLQQAAELERWCKLRTAVLMAGCEFDPTAPLIAASIQTLAARGMAHDFQPQLALIDELHHFAVGSEYDRVLGRRDMHLIGFSATPRRSWERPAPVLTECLFARGLPELIAEDWLAPLRSERIVTPMNKGIDLPALRTIVIARPTRSRRLYQQIVGRGTRKAEGKTECVILEACAAQRDPGQVTLGALVPEPEPESHTPGPPTLYLLDPDAADKWTWQYHGGVGSYSVSADKGVTVYLVPEADSSGRYRAVVDRHGEPGNRFETLTAPLARDEAMHRAGVWLTQNAVLELAASTRWYGVSASAKQIEFLAREGIDATELTRGAATRLIRDHIAGWVVPQIVRRLCNEQSRRRRKEFFDERRQ